jgi:A118 family predicted phage portal protein
VPLPANNLQWPPQELAVVTPVLGQWSAWYEGTPEALRTAYGRGNFNTAGVGPQLALQRQQQHGGFRGILQRFWWGRPVGTDGYLQRDMIHVPIASDLCQASADLLFSDQPTLLVDDQATQDRIEELADDGMYSTLAEAAEVAAALGGVYLRVTWDRALRNAPFLTAIHADAAWPEFQWGHLRAVTFWTIVDYDQNNRVWRHLERHELDANGNGVILHGLYEGSPSNLGRVIPLVERPATAIFAQHVNAESMISTESPGLAVTYIPNQRPQRRWRNDPHGTHLGRSDLDGVEPLMDALDETYASWMRDIRLGKARIMIAKSLLENLGPGQGSFFNADQEAYSPVNALMASGSSGGQTNLGIESVQFKIRYAEHKATAQQLVENILRTSGYSTQTFGEGDTGNVRTATEVEQRERRSLLTRDRKLRLWRPGIADVVEKLLAVDAVIFNSGVTPARPDVHFANGVQETPLALSQTALALFQAESASLEVRVAMVHPDWNDEQVQAEVVKINAEVAAKVPPPLADPFGSGQPPLDGNGQPVNPNDLTGQ